SSAGLITVDDRCRSDQSCVFYGAVGRPLYLQLPKEDYLQLKKINSGTTSDVVFLYRNKKIRINHLDQRWEFNNETKTMIITRAEKEDSGRYRLDSFNSTGFNTGPYSLHLIIEGSLITVDDQCRSDQSCVFYGAVGRPLYLQLPDEEELKLFTIKSDYYSDRILHFKNKIIIGKPSDPRWEFNTENKTMIITRAEKKDSARYRLHTYNSTGTNTGIYYLQLIIEGSLIEALLLWFSLGIAVFVLVWVLEIIVLLALLGGFHIYGRIFRKRSIKRNSRSAESKSFEFPAD
ncbi:hypothetical protein AMEX_G21930, partial [Astyanax mexicanus]